MKYNKRILFTVVIFMGILSASAQSTEGSVTIDKTNRNALILNLNQPEAVTRAALTKRMDRAGLNGKASSGYTKYSGVTFSEISRDKVDIYTMVKKAPNDGSIIYMAVSRGYDNFISSTNDSATSANTRVFLNSMVAEADNQFTTNTITANTAEINKDEKKYKTLVNEQSSLQKRRAEIDNRLIEIEKELSARSEELTKKKNGLEDLKTKKTTIEN